MASSLKTIKARWADPESRAKMEAGLKEYFDKKMKQRLLDLAKGES